MKKTIFLTMILMCGISVSLFPRKSISPIKATNYTTLIINADVTVKLINASNSDAKLSGDDFFMQNVSITQSGNFLIINAAKDKNYKKKGVIYVPARTVREIRINNSASVESAAFLQIPELNILINGDCRVSITNRGKVILTGTENYEVIYALKNRVTE
jgi:Putative auto-transporter adhesin, head GIN domain